MVKERKSEIDNRAKHYNGRMMVWKAKKGICSKYDIRCCRKLHNITLKKVCDIMLKSGVFRLEMLLIYLIGDLT